MILHGLKSSSMIRRELDVWHSEHHDRSLQNFREVALYYIDELYIYVTIEHYSKKDIETCRSYRDSLRA